MASSNRTARLTKLVAALKKRFKPELPAARPLFESLLYGCLLENSTHEAADKAIAGLEKSYFDWNEVRVSTRSELSEVLKPLSDPLGSADRLKRTLQSVFETFYAFDLEPMKKQNLGQSVKQLSACDGVTPFVVAYVTQNGLGGHAIALNAGLLTAMRVMDLINDAELKKKVVPGLERAVPKNKGVDAAALLHLFGVEIGRNPYGKAAKELLLALDPTCKERLPKKPAPPKPKPKPEPEPKAKAKAPAAGKGKSAAKEAPKKGPSKQAPAKKAPVKKKAAPKKASAKKAAAKKVAAKKKPVTKAPVKKKPTKKKGSAKKGSVKKSPAKKKPAKGTTKKATGKKKAAPAKKKPVKKGAAKKSPAKKKPAKKSAAKRKPK